MTSTSDSETSEADEVDTESVHVQSTVPAYQRDEWDAHADELGMSRAEYVRCMVQSGRRIYTGEVTINEGADDDDDDQLREEVLEAIHANGPVSFDVLVQALADDFKERMEGVLNDLQEERLIQYNGRVNGYVAIEESNGEE